MDAMTFEHVSAMPAPTWNFLKMNDTTIEVAEGLEPARNAKIEMGGQVTGDAGAFEDAMLEAQKSWDAAHEDFVVLRNWEEVDNTEKFGGLALSNYQEAADQMELARSLEDELMSMLAAFSGPCILVSHDRAQVERLCCAVVEIRGGYAR